MDNRCNCNAIAWQAITTHCCYKQLVGMSELRLKASQSKNGCSMHSCEETRHPIAAGLPVGKVPTILGGGGRGGCSPKTCQ